MSRTAAIFIIAMWVSSIFAGDVFGTVTCKGVRDSRDVVVYIEEIDSPKPPATSSVGMDQVNLEFKPHVLPIVKGTTVDFINSDDVLHNVFTPDKCAEKMNLGTWPKGETRSYTFKEEGCSSVLLCNVHPEMEAWVLVLQNKYFFRTDKDGAFRIIGVPPGNYNLIAWHERLKNQSVAIEIPEKGEIEVNFTLKRR